MVGPRSRGKTLIIRQGPVEESKSFSKAPGYYHWVLVIFIYSFVYSWIFSVNNFFLTAVNKNFLQFKYFKIFWHAEAVPGEGVLRMYCKFFGVFFFYFKKVAKRLCEDRASVLLVSCGFASCFRSIILLRTLKFQFFCNFD